MRDRRKDVCIVCKASSGLIRKYRMNICRRCFKEIAPKIGFKKYN
ncbi:MAG: 30S ribosomal protein S14 [archaeon]